MIKSKIMDLVEEPISNTHEIIIENPFEILVEHKYGYDKDKDIKELYGEDYEKKDNIRVKLFDKYTEIALSIESGRSILQNPIPIESENLEKWLEYTARNRKRLEEIEKLIVKFIRNNHIK